METKTLTNSNNYLPNKMRTDHSSLISVAKKLAQQYPHIFRELSDDKPYFDDFNEIGSIVNFVEDQELEHGWGDWQLQLTRCSDRSQFINLCIAVIVVLFDPDYLRVDQKNLRHKLRAELSKKFKIKGSSVSDRLKIIKDELEAYPASSKRVYEYAANYLYLKNNKSEE